LGLSFKNNEGRPVGEICYQIHSRFVDSGYYKVVFAARLYSNGSVFCLSYFLRLFAIISLKRTNHASPDIQIAQRSLCFCRQLPLHGLDFRQLILLANVFRDCGCSLIVRSISNPLKRRSGNAFYLLRGWGAFTTILSWDPDWVIVFWMGELCVPTSAQKKTINSLAYAFDRSIQTSDDLLGWSCCRQRCFDVHSE
jgi:hypothetical protein